MAAAAIFNFLEIFEILAAGTLKRVQLRRRAKLGRNRSSGRRDMAIFRFLETAAAAILEETSNF